MTGEPGDARTGPDPARAYELLHDRFGDLEWWPAEGPFEVMMGAVLTQRTAWRNVEIALANLRRAGVVDMASLLALPERELEVLIRPSGTYRQKAARLMALFRMVDRVGGGSLEAFLELPLDGLRLALLSVKGIGPETADSIILYAAGQPAFVVDGYTRRVLERLGVDAGRSYDDVARWFTEGLPRDVELYNNYHAALVELAKAHCRVVPLCDGCPLLPICPTGNATESR
jgi:endonuclease-3 related protein